MKVKAGTPRWFVLALALGMGLGLLGLLPLTLSGSRAWADKLDAGHLGQETIAQPTLVTTPSVSAFSPAAEMGTLGISGSGVEPLGFSCYEANKTQSLCFTVYNGSDDAEWLDGITVTFPSAPPLAGVLWKLGCRRFDWKPGQVYLWLDGARQPGVLYRQRHGESGSHR